MYPETIEKNPEYYYYHWQFFQERFDLIHALLEKDFCRGMHEQEFYELNIIMSGQGMHYIKENRIPAKVGDVFVIPPHVSHGYVGKDGFDVFHILISDGFMNKYMLDLQQLPSFFALFSAEPLLRSSLENPLHLSLSHEHFEQIKPILTQLLTYEETENSFHSLIRSHLAMQLIALLCKKFNDKFNTLDDAPPRDFAIMNAIAYMHEHYHETIKLEHLAKLSYLSRTSFIEKFKSICKQSPSAYLTEIRINAAKNLLLKTNHSIHEIAEKTGFYDSAHFTKSFKRATGKSPTAFRNTQKETSLA